MQLLREVIGSNLRAHREQQKRSLRDVSASARVSLGYLSEIERGRKEASSELLACICDALDVELADLLDGASTDLRHQAFLDAAHRDGRADSTTATDVRLIFGQDEREVVPV